MYNSLEPGPKFQAPLSKSFRLRLQPSKIAWASAPQPWLKELETQRVEKPAYLYFQLFLIRAETSGWTQRAIAWSLSRFFQVYTGLILQARKVTHFNNSSPLLSAVAVALHPPKYPTSCERVEYSRQIIMSVQTESKLKRSIRPRHYCPDFKHISSDICYKTSTCGRQRQQLRHVVKIRRPTHSLHKARRFRQCEKCHVCHPVLHETRQRFEGSQGNVTRSFLISSSCSCCIFNCLSFSWANRFYGNERF